MTKILAVADRNIMPALWEQPAPVKERDELSGKEQSCRVVAQRTRDLLNNHGWCLWECSMLGGDIIVVLGDESVTGYPEGYPVYTEAELEELFKDGVSEATLRLVHEAKKMAGAKVTKCYHK